jgi:uncharacterized SAM-binding protein YcdF (DUF218 family)
MKLLTIRFSRRQLAISVSIISALIVLLVAVCAVRNLGQWLIIRNPLPEKLDLLFTFGGEPRRYDHSKDLFERYPDSFWAISVGYFPVFDTIGLDEIVRRNAAIEGLDTSRIIINDTCRSTGAEIRIFADLVDIALGKDSATAADSSSMWQKEKQRFSRWIQNRSLPDTLHIGLISHHYHTRRIKMLFGRRIKNRPVVFYMLPVPYTDNMHRFFRKRKWWRHESDGSFVISEAIKLIYYFTLRGKVPVRE